LSWVYSGMLQHLDPDVPVYGIQSPAMSDMGRRPATLAEMAARYVASIRSVQPDGPYRVIGWSLGGTFAHEVAVQLQQDGQEVSFLAILDTNMVYDPVAGQSPVPGELLEYQPGDPEQSAAEIRELSARVPTLNLLHGEEQRIAVSAFHYNRAIRLRHLPSSAFRGDVLFVRATADKGELIRAVDTWGPYVHGRIDEIRIPCTHFELLAMAPLMALDGGPSAQPVALIGEAVSEALRRGSPAAG
jgi:nonribosomal peptide synthetase DhbF